ARLGAAGPRGPGCDGHAAAPAGLAARLRVDRAALPVPRPTHPLPRPRAAAADRPRARVDPGAPPVASAPRRAARLRLPRAGGRGRLAPRLLLPARLRPARRPP